MALAPEQVQVLQHITDVLGWTSFVLNTAVFVGYSLIPKARHFPSSVFWYALIPAIIQSAGVPIGTITGYPARINERSAACTVQGMIVHYGFLSWSTWVFLCTVHLYLLLVKARVFSEPRRAEQLYLVIGFVFPFLPVLVGLIAQVHAPAGVWCFLSSQDNGYWILSLAYIFIGPLALASLILTVIIVVHVQLRVHRMKKENKAVGQEYQQAVSSVSSFQVRLITFITLFCSIFLLATAVRIRQIIIAGMGGPIALTYEWSLTLTVAFGLTGIIHLLAFATNKQLYTQAYKTCRRAHEDPEDNEYHCCHCCV
eukprot:TRINITY_DN726_c0_g1_i3.p1 TRINITY_DN726_c0_g1~~TRINITY_DN726_c0_g1_i3.p1  ORF type:complete len:312 (+),score=27.68 TRINITY_DN726_c0_g1_i3:1275-2210(+)